MQKAKQKTKQQTNYMFSQAYVKSDVYFLDLAFLTILCSRIHDSNGCLTEAWLEAYYVCIFV